MKLSLLYTKRGFEKRVFYDLVWEWEDILAKSNKLKLYDIYSDVYIYKILKLKYIRKLLKRFPFLVSIFLPNRNGIIFDMVPLMEFPPRQNREHIIPWLIDFWLREDAFPRFNDFYKQYPVVLVSSKEVYEELLKHKNLCPDINIKHLALSLPDKYRITENTNFIKEFDVVLMGRQNPVLEAFFYRYAKEHPDMKYVYRIMENEQFNYYTNTGEYLGNINQREKFISLMRKAKIALYSTPDIDTDHKRANGYNQVTPKFLEWLSCGAHIIARYKPNPDTEYYNLSAFSSSIKTYDEFSKAMDYCRSHEVDMSKYSDYLEQHYTSVRAKQLEEIIQNL